MILGPAALVGLPLEEGFTRRVLAEAGSEPGLLPLMSHALHAMWEGREQPGLGEADFDRIGGLVKALAKVGEARLESLGEGPAREEARRLLVSLVDTRQGIARATRRPVQLDNHRPSDPEQHRAFLAALAALSPDLVTVGKDGQGRDLAELAHEVLARKWGTLRGWLEEDADELRLRDHLEEQARLWKDHQARDDGSDYLLSGQMLKDATDVATRHSVSNEVRDFLDNSSWLTQATVRRDRHVVMPAFHAVALVALMTGVVSEPGDGTLQLIIVTSVALILLLRWRFLLELAARTDREDYWSIILVGSSALGVAFMGNSPTFFTTEVFAPWMLLGLAGVYRTIGQLVKIGIPVGRNGSEASDLRRWIVVLGVAWCATLAIPRDAVLVLQGSGLGGGREVWMPPQALAWVAMVLLEVGLLHVRVRWVQGRPELRPGHVENQLRHFHVLVFALGPLLAFARRQTELTAVESIWVALLALAALGPIYALTLPLGRTRRPRSRPGSFFDEQQPGFWLTLHLVAAGGLAMMGAAGLQAIMDMGDSGTPSAFDLRLVSGGMGTALVAGAGAWAIAARDSAQDRVLGLSARLPLALAALGSLALAISLAPVTMQVLGRLLVMGEQAIAGGTIALEVAAVAAASLVFLRVAPARGKTIFGVGQVIFLTMALGMWVSATVADWDWGFFDLFRRFPVAFATVLCSALISEMALVLCVLRINDEEELELSSDSPLPNRGAAPSAPATAPQAQPQG